MIVELIRLTHFHTEEWTPSGPGGEKGEDSDSVSLISSLDMGTDERSCERRPLPARGSLGGKRWSGRTLLIATESVEPRREGGETPCLSWGNELFGRPYVVRRGFGEEVSPIDGFSSFYGLEVADLGLPGHEEGIRAPVFFALLLAFVNSCQRVVRRGVHQGLDLGEGRDRVTEA